MMERNFLTLIRAEKNKINNEGKNNASTFSA